MTTKSAHIDWYSFTTRLKLLNSNPETMIEVASHSLEYVLGTENYNNIFTRDGWELGGGRRPYTGGFVNEKQGMRVWFGGQATVLVEISGSGCEWLRERDLLMPVIQATYERCTRIDIAVDIDDGGLVDAIMDSAGNNRMKSREAKDTPTGYTRYMGARTSEKFLRIYEYKDPHPRAGVTRVEYEHKKRQAKITAGWVTQMSVEDVADSIGKIYDWKHEMMKPSDYVPKMPSPVSAARTDAGKLSWIYKQVAPAIQKLIAEGKVRDPEQWLIDTFMPKDYKDLDGNVQTNFLTKIDDNDNDS